jgi:hypothetical protein
MSDSGKIKSLPVFQEGFFVVNFLNTTALTIAAQHILQLLVREGL